MQQFSDAAAHAESSSRALPGGFHFEEATLRDLARRARRDYRGASPFPHAVFDDFLPGWVVKELVREFPKPGAIDWERHVHGKSLKLACADERQFGPFTRHVFAQFHTSTFVTFLEELTGIDGLIPDPHLYGGGLHQIDRGGLLGIHADFNRYDRLRLDRRLNLLLYLNEDWQESWGGELELWDEAMTRPVRKVVPIANRVVIFNTTDTAFHGHPEPLACPPGWTRKSIALYFYSNGRPAAEHSKPHSTLYQKRPGETRRLTLAVRGAAVRAGKLLTTLATLFLE